MKKIIIRISIILASLILVGIISLTIFIGVTWRNEISTVTSIKMLIDENEWMLREIITLMISLKKVE